VEWPPDFSAELDRRLKLEHRLTAEPALLNGALLRYAEDPAAFISDCVYLYEPRNANSGARDAARGAVSTAARIYRMAA
jgi:hypothetical protein